MYRLVKIGNISHIPIFFFSSLARLNSGLYFSFFSRNVSIIDVEATKQPGRRVGLGMYCRLPNNLGCTFIIIWSPLKYLFRGESSTIPSSLHVNHFLKFTLSVTFIPPYTFIRHLKSIRRKIRIFRAATKWLLFGRQNTVRNGLKRTYDLFLPQDWHPDGIPREKWEKSITVCLHSDKRFKNSNRKLYLFSKTTDYGHMKAKSLILCCPNSNLNPK